jgi:hypothetical protein
MNHAEVSGKVRKGRSLDFGVKKEGLTPAPVQTNKTMV